MGARAVAISGAEAGYQDLSQHHRGHDVDSGYVRQSFETHDAEERFGYRATYSKFPTGVYSPRHRHNFDQLRFILEGEWEYARRRYGPGWLGLFPEGVFYGPAKSLQPGRHIVLQYPGSTRALFISRDEERQVQRAMVDGGASFRDGICAWPDGRKQDGGEALWESWSGQRIEYPTPGYGDPLWINTAAREWTPTDMHGVAAKSLVSMGEPGPTISLLRLDAGTSIEPTRAGWLVMAFLFEGHVELDGSEYPSVSSFYYPPDAPGRLTAVSDACLLSVAVRAGA